MAVPAFRTSPARKRKRRSHLALKKPQWVIDPVSGMPKMPHRASKVSGYVRPGLQIEVKESE